MSHDPRDPRDLITHGVAALVEAGVARSSLPPGDSLLAAPEDALRLLDSLVEPSSDSEPSEWAELELRLDGVAPVPVDYADVPDRVRGAWLGRCVGNTLGKPLESVEWTPARIRAYLELAEAWPLTDFVPAAEHAPLTYRLREDCWRTTTRGNVRFVTRDDDLDYTVLALELLEAHGRSFTTTDVADSWLRLLPFGKLFTAEAVAYRNVVDSVPVPATATVRNPYREWIGALIRGDLFGMVSPGDPLTAARMGWTDARLSHVRNGIYGEMWVSAMVALGFGVSDPRNLVERSLGVVPSTSRLHGAVGRVLELYDAGRTWDEAVSWIHALDYYYVHTINNASAIAAALLWSEGDFSRAIALAVTAGLDTDSNGATVGAVAGTLAGAAGIPDHWTAPFDDRLRTGLSERAELRITDVVARTLALIPRNADAAT